MILLLPGLATSSSSFVVSTKAPSGRSSPVFGPCIVRIGVIFPVSSRPKTAILFENCFELLTKISSLLESTNTENGFDTVVALPVILWLGGVSDTQPTEFEAGIASFNL